jgi:hypothetical protein
LTRRSKGYSNLNGLDPTLLRIWQIHSEWQKTVLTPELEQAPILHA